MIRRQNIEERLVERGLDGSWLGAPPSGFESLRLDSRMVRPGDLFCAVKGVRHDGHDFLGRAAAAGATAALVERVPGTPGLPCLVVPDTRAAAAHLAFLFAGDPASGLHVVGITGTNGKTTTAILARHLLASLGPSAALGTLGVIRSDGTTEPGLLTTPDPLELAVRLADLAASGTRYVSMEVSSHALDQHRVDALSFACVAFTNLTRDHLDYHADMASYRDAKLRLLSLLAPDGAVVLNADDPAWDGVETGGRRSLRYGTGRVGEVRAERVRYEPGGSSWDLVAEDERAPVHLPLLGSFNVANALGASAVARAAGLSTRAIADALSEAPQVPGRMEVILRDPALVVRDYAHTPDALARALEALRPTVRGRLIVVFGCGGDRDPGKRPLMGRIAVSSADHAIVTSDNPRTEDPERIVREIVDGLEPGAWETVVDRRQAIGRALSIAGADDVVLLAGKGHETYQEIHGRRQPFDEAHVVPEVLAGLGGGS